VVIEDEPSSMRGGQEMSHFEVCKSLANKGHKIHLVYKDDGDLLGDYRRFCQTVLKVRRYSIDRTKPFRSLAAYFYSIGMASKYRPDVVYVKQYHDTFFASALSHLISVPLVCHIRLRPPESICGQWRIGLKGVKRFIAISNSTKSEWVHAGTSERSIDVVPNGIDTGFFTPAGDVSAHREKWRCSKEDLVLSYVGRVDKEKGLECLLEAMAQLKRKLPNAKLVVAGKPLVHASAYEGVRYEQSLMQLAKALQIEDRVIFAGHVSDPVNLYRASDVVVLPTRVSEAFGRVLVEAMACGIPAVASRIGGIPEILTGEFETGLFEAGNPGHLSEVLDKMLRWRRNDPGLGGRCREHIVDHFNLEATIRGIEAVLLKSLNE